MPALVSLGNIHQVKSAREAEMMGLEDWNILVGTGMMDRVTLFAYIITGCLIVCLYY